MAKKSAGLRTVTAVYKPPTAFLTEAGAVLKLGTGIYKMAEEVGEAVELITRISITDSYANAGQHDVTVKIENRGQSGTYIESLDVRIPKMKSGDKPLTKDGTNLAAEFYVRRGTLGRDHETLKLPMRIPPGESLIFHINTKLLDRDKFKDRPFLHATMVLSQLDEQKERTVDVPFRIRWA